MILNNLMMKQIILSFCFLSLWNFDLFSQPSFQPETIQNKDGKTIVFRKLDPSKLKKKKKYPLVIFLHGSGERGSDNIKQLVHGSTMFLTKTVKIILLLSFFLNVRKNRIGQPGINQKKVVRLNMFLTIRFSLPLH